MKNCNVSLHRIAANGAAPGEFGRCALKQKKEIDS
jgi:hypothetical protein